MITLQNIKDNCSQFLLESKGIPTFKLLSNSYEELSKVKVRHKKKETLVSHTMDYANDAKIYNRSVFTYGNNFPTPLEDNKQIYYVFPTDGYEYLYSTSVKHSDTSIRAMFFEFLEKLEPQDSNKIPGLISDLLNFTYTNKNLCDGLYHENEILFYNISCFYVVAQNKYPKYNDLYEMLEG